MIQDGALTLGGWIWSLMVLYAFGFIGVPGWHCCSSGRGSMVSVGTLTSLAGSSCVLILFSLPDVSLSHCCIHLLQNLETTKSNYKACKKIKINYKT